MQSITEEYISCDYPDYNDRVDFELNLFGARKQNVYPEVDVYYANLENMSDRLVDFIEIATIVYLADQHVVRCQGRVDEHGWLWHRRINLIIGVRDVAFWQQEEVCHTLSRLLRFLSDDSFTFQFTAITDGPPPQQQYLHFKDTDHDDRPGRVMMFSGGLDSLGGAVQSLFVDGIRTILVRHETFSNHKKQFSTLEHELYERSERRAFFFTVHTKSNSKDKKEYTQRCRSFLYFAMGATIANVVGLHEVNFYENGPISINLAMNPQVVGGRATRTTHPQTLFFFQKLFRIISGDDSFVVSNPFWNKTKSEIVKGIVEAGAGDLIKHTMSCAHTWMQNNIKLHCGVCSQCIDRRVALIAAGAQDLDKKDGYLVDFFREAVDAKYNRNVKVIDKASADDEEEEDITGKDPYHFDEPNKNLLTSYFLRGQQIASFEGYYQFEEAFPMICDALLYVPGLDPQHTAYEIYRLHQRFAQDILKVKEYATSKEYLNQFSAINRQIAPDSLCGILLAIPRPAVGVIAEANRIATAKNAFVKMGQFWQCRFDGGQTFFIGDYKGNGYILELLRNPAQEFSFEQLSPSPINTDLQRWLDDNDVQYSTEYFQLLAADQTTINMVSNLADELELSLEDPCSAMSEEAREENQRKLDILKDYLKKTKGKNGKPRKSKTPYQFKRDRVIHAINDVIAQIESCDEGKEMAEHLKAQLVYTSTAVYKPLTGMEWHTINN